MVKVKPVQNGRTTRMSFSRINEVIGMPNLIEIQKNSYNWFLEEGSDVLSALEDCVVYKANGPYREKSSGLSCYYSYTGNTDDFIQYASVGASDAFRYLYSYELSGSLDEDGIAYVSADWM